jgi:adenylate cyclase class 2
MAYENLEIEIRFKVGDVKKLREKLRKIGAKCTEHWQGYDVIFDRKNELREKGRILRLRFRKQWGKRAKLTYKGPYQKHIFKIREELEVWVDEPQISLAILKKIDFEPVIQYEKRTDLWEYQGIELVIEKLPRLGCFMEIEGSGKEIRKVAKILGFDIKEGIKKSYRQYFEAIDKKKKEWFFEK